MERSSARKSLAVIIYNHMDPMHRRCFNRSFDFKGTTFISYADLEERYILENLDLCRKHDDYKFVIETVLVARKFMERHPEMVGELCRLSRDGRLYLSGCGDNIIDVNMVLGESIVRNFLSGLLWVEEILGQKTNLGNRFDAFGNSAQLPQILRGCELKWCAGLLYTRPAGGRYWRGLDGSTVLVDNLPNVGEAGHYRVYAPCPACRGAGTSVGMVCESCGGLGIDRADGDKDWQFSEIDDDAFGDFDCGLVRVGGEELLPHAGTLDWMERLRDHYDVRFALPEVAMPYMQPWLDRLDDPDEKDLCTAVELNPNNTGCYVTRIKTKQNCRRQEYDLLSAESLSVMASRFGYGYPGEQIQATWQKLFFTMFHDAITGTHVDPAHDELRDIWSEIDKNTAAIKAQALASILDQDPNQVSVVNLTGSPATNLVEVVAKGDAETFAMTALDGSNAKILEHIQAKDRVKATILVDDLPPYSARIFSISIATAVSGSIATDVGLARGTSIEGTHTDGSKDEQTTIENGRFMITADSHGLLAVYDKKLQIEILKTGSYRPGEFILEHDEGSPWATLSPDMERTHLSSQTRLIRRQIEPGFQRLLYEIPVMHSYAEDAVGISWSVTLWAELDRIDFSAKVDWEDFNHRLRIAMPVPFNGSHAYEIPYGILHRKAYEPLFDQHKLFARWSDPTGDWPAINWAGVDSPDISVALMNKGTPSYRIEKDASGGQIMLLSVLRSPCIPTYLHEPRAYTMTDWDGIRDSGTHQFDYAVTAYGSGFADSPVVIDADQYNAGLLVAEGAVSIPPMPLVQSANVRAVCLKGAEKGDGLILRLAEYQGKPGHVTVVLPQVVTGVERTNLLERQLDLLEMRDGKVMLQLRAFEIATLRLKLSPCVGDIV